MINRNLLPLDFVIKRDEEHELWPEFLTWLNEAFEGVLPKVKFEGKVDGYYGLIEDCPIIMPEPDTADVLTLEEWMSVINGQDIDFIETYNGESHPITRCVIISDSAPHGGKYALIRECVSINYPDCIGYALKSDCQQLLDGRWMLESHADEDDNIVFSDEHGRLMDSTSETAVFTEDEEWIDTNYHNDYIRIESNGVYFSSSSAAEDHGYYYSERKDCWMHEDDQPECVEDCNAGYHHLSRKIRFNDSAEFTIGFEIEKEDDDAGMIHYQKLYNETGWCKENDSSLNDDGYELVSPAFNLQTDDLDREINASADLQALINADFSNSCGGHINVGSPKYSTEQLFEGLSGFFPLLYALYDGRLDRDYCKAKKKHRYYDKDKYSSVYIRDKVVEFRIFSAVSSVNNLLWRRDLIRIMCENFNKSEVDVLRMMVDSRSKLYKHLRKVYNQDKLIDKIESFVLYCDQFNNKKLPKVDVSKIKADNLEEASSSLAI